MTVLKAASSFHSIFPSLSLVVFWIIGGYRKAGTSFLKQKLYWRYSSQKDSQNYETHHSSYKKYCFDFLELPWHYLLNLWHWPIKYIFGSTEKLAHEKEEAEKPLTRDTGPLNIFLAQQRSWPMRRRRQRSASIKSSWSVRRWKSRSVPCRYFFIFFNAAFSVHVAHSSLFTVYSILSSAWCLCHEQNFF